MNIAEAPSIYRVLMQHDHVTAGDLLRRPSQREEFLACVPLYLRRQGKSIELPDDDQQLEAGDQLLFAGVPRAQREQQALLRNDKIRDYVLTGRDPPTGWLWQKLQANKTASSTTD